MEYGWKKRQGMIGSYATALLLTEHGWSVFFDSGDTSRVDVIGEKNGKVVRFQCKTTSPCDGALRLVVRKTGPCKYNRKYKESDFDYFSLYDLKNRKLYFIPSRILRKYSSSTNLRITAAKTKQTKNVNVADKYSADRVVKTL